MIWDIFTLLSPTIALGLFLLVRDTRRGRNQRAQLKNITATQPDAGEDMMENWKIHAAASLEPGAELQNQDAPAQGAQAPAAQADPKAPIACTDVPEGHRLKHTSYVPEGVRQDPPMTRD